MTPERWERICQVYEQARDQEPGEREAFLDRTCSGDADLRREVESMLAAEANIGDFIAAPALKDAAELLTAETPGTLVGRQLGHYQILSFIGAGGMGEVYAAQDPRLSRRVAIKLLPAAVSRDDDRLRRFSQEARAVGMLNHPNILTIHDLGTHEGAPYIVSELLEGETLRERLKKGTISPTRTVEIALQITRGLAAAHERGIVHRDLKPENLFITTDGRVKVLDFGLAKLTQPNGAEAKGHDFSVIRSIPGMVMGTVGYMAPEQLRGEEADHRADIFAFGVILYEMLTGNRPFHGDSAAETMSSILRQETPELPASIREQSLELGRVIRRCLEKRPEQRFQSAGDLGFALEGLISSRLNISVSRGHGVSSGAGKVDGAPTIPLNLRWRRIGMIGWAGWALAGVFMLATIGMTIAYFRRPTAITRIVPFTSFPGHKSNPAFSPDGNQVAFYWDGGDVDQAGIYVKLIDSGTPLRIATFPGGPAPSVMSLVWSPDGRQIAFARRGENSGIYAIPALGGPERKLTDMTGTFAWSPDGKALAVAGNAASQTPFSIFMVSIETGEKRRLTNPQAGSFGDVSPAFSPDGQTVAFIRGPNFLVGDVYIIPVTRGDPVRLTFDNLQMEEGLAWTANGREIIYSSPRGGLPSLWKISASGGRPRRVIGTGEYAFSPATSIQGGYLAYVYRRVDRNIWRIPGPYSDATDSSPVKLIASTRDDVSPQFSPDGKRIVFVSDRTGSREIWVCDNDGQDAVQLTNFGGGHTGTPRWSPDGNMIAFDSRPDGQSDIFLISPEGGRPQRLTTENTDDVLPSWSSDGQWVYFASNRGGNWQIWKKPVRGGQAVQVTTNGGYQAIESPDGRYLYYAKREPGIWRMEVKGGEESLVLSQARYGQWALLDKGICFIGSSDSQRHSIEFFNPATGKLTQLASLRRTTNTTGGPNLAVSADGQWTLYWQADQIDNDIMLVENFH
ncbi:MAG: serine/threonine-protein kinase [Acidobacteriota bacterium]|nr:MAG: serine/threonine-protein kinase [Acidobacteriota bacterium]